MLKLFYGIGTCALASHIALEEAGAAYEAVRVDFGKDEQKQPGYLAINPSVPRCTWRMRIGAPACDGWMTTRPPSRRCNARCRPT